MALVGRIVVSWGFLSSPLRGWFEVSLILFCFYAPTGVGVWVDCMCLVFLVGCASRGFGGALRVPPVHPFGGRKLAVVEVIRCAFRVEGFGSVEAIDGSARVLS